MGCGTRSIRSCDKLLARTFGRRLASDIVIFLSPGSNVDVPVVLTLLAGTAWAYWSAGSVAGSGGAAGASTVNQGATPTASAAVANVTVSWAASTLASGVPVDGYVVKRYDATTSKNAP